MSPLNGATVPVSSESSVTGAQLTNRDRQRRSHGSVRAGGAGEPARRPDSVRGRVSRTSPELPSIWASRCRDGHATLPADSGGPPSRGRCRPRRLRGARPRTGSFLVLLQVGFTQPRRSPDALVVSYTTVSPLPALRSEPEPLAVCLCGTVPRVTPGGRYPPPCPAESGPSSTTNRLVTPWPRQPGRLARTGSLAAAQPASSLLESSGDESLRRRRSFSPHLIKPDHSTRGAHHDR
jgi:hypothetical protein